MHLHSSFIPVSITVPSALVGWHQQLNGREFEQALGGGEGRGAWRAAVQGSQRDGRD